MFNITLSCISNGYFMISLYLKSNEILMTYINVMINPKKKELNLLRHNGLTSRRLIRSNFNTVIYYDFPASSVWNNISSAQRLNTSL